MTAKGKTKLIWDINAARMHVVCGNKAAARALLLTIRRRLSRISAKERATDGINYSELVAQIKAIEQACYQKGD